MRGSRLKVAVLVIAVGLIWTGTLFAQAVGTITGRVTDSSSAVVPGAMVTARNQGTDVTREATTDQAGHYVLPLLPIGKYTISAALAGFRTVENRDVSLEVGESRTLDFVLQISSISTEVTVNSQVAEVELQRSNATLGQVIHSEQVAQLPLNGRNFVQLALLGPGTVAGRAGSFLNQGQTSEVSYRGSMSVSAQGMRENANDWLYDGVDNNELTANGVAVLPSVDAINEFRVLTYNFSAQYGSRGGTTVLVSSKSGTNQFHGTLFEYLRNDVLDARNFFDGAKKGKYIQNEYGFSVGGPVIKDKTFFFGDFQGNKIRQGLTVLQTVPTAAMHNGDFSESFPGSPKVMIYDPATTTKNAAGQWVRSPFSPDPYKIPTNRIDKIGKALIDLLPMPTFTDRLANNYLANPVKTLNDAQFNIRVDHNISNDDRLFVRFTWENANQYLPTGLPDFGATGSYSSNQTFKTYARNVALSETHVLKSKKVNQFTVGYNRVFNYIQSFGYLSNESQKLGIPGANLGSDETSGLTRMTFQNFGAALGDRGYSPFQGGTDVYHIADSLVMVHGAHSFNVGFTARFMQLNLLGDEALAGALAFQRFFTSAIKLDGSLDATTGNSIATLLLGLPSSGSRNNQLNGSVKGRRWKEYRGFIDDTWAVRRNLTFTLGFAYAVTTPQSEAADRFSNLDFATGKIYVGGTVGVNTDYGNVQPRFGFAWSPFGNSNTVVRGGYGMFYDVSAVGGSTGPYQNPPYANAYAFTSDNITPVRTLSTGFPDNNQRVDPANYTGTWYVFPTDLKQGRIQQWNLNLEQKLPGAMVFSLAYTGTEGSRLFNKGQNLNTATPGSGFNPASRRPYPQYQNINATLNNAWLEYHALQVRLERRAAKGMYVLGSYSYGKALSSGMAGLPATPGIQYYPIAAIDSNADKASADTDLRHNLTVSYLYELPIGKGQSFLSNLPGVADAILGGWQFNGIVVAQSGFPLGMSMSSNQSGTSLGNRPNRVCDGSLADPKVGKWFDTTCFVAPTAGVLGNAARTTLFGPGRWNVDMSLYKKFRVTETSSLQFRSEFFNLFNHAQFMPPNTSVGNPLFGMITSTVKSSRQVQFALKFVF